MTPTLLSTGVEQDLLRLRQEFLDMPGLCLTAPQVVRLLGVPSEAAALMLTTMQREGYLFRTMSGAYRRTYPAQS
jgi:DNA-binding IclR family transcriptional regulator